MKALYAIVGMRHFGTEQKLADLKHGERLVLAREPDNPHDKNAVMVSANGERIGYVKATQAAGLARRMDGDSPGRPWFGTLTSDGRWPMIEVEE